MKSQLFFRIEIEIHEHSMNLRMHFPIQDRIFGLLKARVGSGPYSKYIHRTTFLLRTELLQCARDELVQLEVGRLSKDATASPSYELPRSILEVSLCSKNLLCSREWVLAFGGHELL